MHKARLAIKGARRERIKTMRADNRAALAGAHARSAAASKAASVGAAARALASVKGRPGATAARAALKAAIESKGTSKVKLARVQSRTQLEAARDHDGRRSIMRGLQSARKDKIMFSERIPTPRHLKSNRTVARRAGASTGGNG